MVPASSNSVGCAVAQSRNRSVEDSEGHSEPADDLMLQLTPAPVQNTCITDMYKNRLLFRLLQTQHNKKSCLIISLYKGLAIQPWPSNPAMAIYFLPHPNLSHGWYEENQLSLSSHCPVGDVLIGHIWLWTLSTNRKFLSCHLPPQGRVAHCGSHLIIFLSNKSHLFITLQKKSTGKLSLPVGLLFALFQWRNLLIWYCILIYILRYCFIISDILGVFSLLYFWSWFIYARYFNPLNSKSVTATSLQVFNKNHSTRDLRLQYFCLSIGFSKAYYHDSQKQDIRIQFLRLGKEGGTTSVI